MKAIGKVYEESWENRKRLDVYKRQRNMRMMIMMILEFFIMVMRFQKNTKKKNWMTA